MREAANLTNIEKSGAVRSSIEVLKQRGILAVLIDQHHVLRQDGESDIDEERLDAEKAIFFVVLFREEL